MYGALQIVPIVLAAYAVSACAEQYLVDRRKTQKKVMFLGVISGLLLIMAQSSWFVTSVLQGNLLGTWFANYLWLAFNISTMLAFLLLAKGGAKNVKKPTPSGD